MSAYHSRSGEHSSLAKLTAKDVYAIRRMLRDPNANRAEIGRLFGITRSYVRKIGTRERWRDLPEEPTGASK